MGGKKLGVPLAFFQIFSRNFLVEFLTFDGWNFFGELIMVFTILCRLLISYGGPSIAPKTTSANAASASP